MKMLYDEKRAKELAEEMGIRWIEGKPRVSVNGKAIKNFSAHELMNEVSSSKQYSYSLNSEIIYTSIETRQDDILALLQECINSIRKTNENMQKNRTQITQMSKEAKKEGNELYDWEGISNRESNMNNDIIAA